MIGIILHSTRIKRPQEQDKDPYVLFYMKLAQKHKVDVCLYSINQLSAGRETVDGHVYSYQSQELIYKTVPIPKVNLYKINSSIRKESALRKINQLRVERDYRFFNACSKKDRNKNEDYKYLSKFKEIRPYLPKTKTLRYDTLLSMLTAHSKVFIKPKHGGQGNGIHVLSKNGDKYSAIRIDHHEMKEEMMSRDRLKSYFNQHFRHPSNFIVQQGIRLKRYNGQRFDFRVSPQKNRNDRWQVTGMIGRLAAPGWAVTNIDQGGTIIHNLRELIRKETKEKIYRVSLRIAKALEKRFIDVNDLGLDFAMDQEGTIWFLEANFRPNRKLVNVKRNRIPFEHVCAIYRAKQGYRKSERGRRG